MTLLVYGAGVVGSLLAVRLHEAGHDVELLARGERLATLRRHGVRLAEQDSSTVREVRVPVVDRPAGPYDLIAVVVRTHQVLGVLESLVDVEGDVLLLVHWAAGAEPLAAVIGPERLLLGYGAEGGRMDGDVVRHRAASLVTRLAPMPVGEPDGRSTARVRRIVRMLHEAGIHARHQPRMVEWLIAHAAFEVPLGPAVRTAGGPRALADDRDALRLMVRDLQRTMAAVPTSPVPRGFGALQALPEGLLTTLFRGFLRSQAVAYTALGSTAPAAVAELDLLAEQLRAASGAQH